LGWAWIGSWPSSGDGVCSILKGDPGEEKCEIGAYHVRRKTAHHQSLSRSGTLRGRTRNERGRCVSFWIQYRSWSHLELVEHRWGRRQLLPLSACAVGDVLQCESFHVSWDLEDVWMPFCKSRKTMSVMFLGEGIKHRRHTSQACGLSGVWTAWLLRKDEQEKPKTQDYWGVPRRWLVIWSRLAQVVPQSFHLQVKHRLFVLFRPIWSLQRWL